MCLGIPGCIVRIDDRDHQLATVDICGVRRQINVSCVVGENETDACIGMWVLVHVGFAMSRIDEDEAKATLKILTELGEAQADIEAINAMNSLPPLTR